MIIAAREQLSILRAQLSPGAVEDFAGAVEFLNEL